MQNRSDEYYRSLVRKLASYPSETEWIEFKANNADPERIAKYISALSNEAAIHNKTCGYLIWGVNDETHSIIGTKFRYRLARKGSEELEAWLARMVNPKINFSFHEVELDDALVTLLEIPHASIEPTKYSSIAYARIGSNLKPLTAFPELEAQLWRTFDDTPAEFKIAASDISENDLVMLLDYPGYYRALGAPIPSQREQVLLDFETEGFARKNDAGNWDITNLGALMIAVDLNQFRRLNRKSIRVIKYKGETRTSGEGEREFPAGYALSHEIVVRHIMDITPREEVIKGAIRTQKTAFPEIAIRELLANMMVHQDIEQQGTNPMVEIFDNRIEFSNAGAPLVNIDRIIDTVPISRNNKMAGFMRKCGICEERGSGYDKVIEATSENRLIAPIVQNQSEQFTKIAIFSHIPFESTTKQDRIRTCYMQACLSYVNFKTIGNLDVRNLFGLDSSKSSQVSKLIKAAMESGAIKLVDPEAAPKQRKYIPYWA